MLAYSSSLLILFVRHDLQVTTVPLSAINCPNVSSTLSHPKPSKKKKRKKKDTQDQQKWGKEDRMYFPLVPSPMFSCQNMEPWPLKQREQRHNEASLCWAAPVQGLTEHSIWLGTTKILQNQHQVTLFGSASFMNHYITLWVSLSHYFIIIVKRQC